jgi:hypothetical protein
VIVVMGGMGIALRGAHAVDKQRLCPLWKATVAELSALIGHRSDNCRDSVNGWQTPLLWRDYALTYDGGDHVEVNILDFGGYRGACNYRGICSDPLSQQFCFFGWRLRVTLCLRSVVRWTRSVGPGNDKSATDIRQPSQLIGADEENHKYYGRTF